MTTKTLKTRIQLKSDTSTNWAKATNFVPLRGEICFYTDLKKFKVGDGTAKIGSLDFYNAESVGEANLTWGGKNYSGTFGPLDAALIPQLGANRLAFGKIAQPPWRPPRGLRRRAVREGAAGAGRAAAAPRAEEGRAVAVLRRLPQPAGSARRGTGS